MGKKVSTKELLRHVIQCTRSLVANGKYEAAKRNKETIDWLFSQRHDPRPWDVDLMCR